MAIALVGQAGANGASGGSPLTITYSSTGGNTLIITGHLYDLGNNVFVAPTSITDTAGNTWQVSANSSNTALTAQNPPTASLADPDDGGTSHQSDWVAWCVGAAHVTSVTVAWAGGQTTFQRIALAEYSGIVQFDNSWAGGSATAGASGSVSASLTVNVTGELAVGAVDFGGAGSSSIPTGWTQFSSSGGQCAYLIGPAVGAFSPTWTDTVAGSYTGAAALFSPVALGGPNWTPQRYGQPAPASMAPWEQRPYRSIPGAADTPANPLVTPLDTAWQADAQYSHLYNDSHLRDRRQYFYQRPLVSDPNLLAAVNADPLALNPEQSNSSDMWRVAVVPAFYDRREVPQQRQYYLPPTPFLLENELLGGAGTAMRYDAPAWTRLPSWPQQRLYISDPLLLTTAELENELLGGGETPKYYRVPATHADRREVPQQRLYISDPLLLTTAELENELLGGADAARHWLPAAFTDRRLVPQQRPYVSDPLLLTAAELENELLGGAGTAMRYNTPGTHYDRREVPQQRLYVSDPLLLTTALLENELLGGAGTLMRYLMPAYYDRREVPQQRAYISDPSFYPPQNNLDLLLAGQDYLDLHQHQAATHYDRREVPQQRLYISDPSFYPVTAPTDPLTVAWGAGGVYWHLYNQAADITDRREVPQQRAYVSDPLLLTTAELENELLGSADTIRHWLAAAYWDRRLVPQQRPYVSDPLLLTTAELENELLGGGGTSRYYLAAAYWDRREYPQQRPYLGVDLTTALLENELLGGADTGRHYAWFTDRREAPQQRLYVSDPLLLSPPLPLDPTLSAWASLQVAYLTPALLYDRREVPQQRLYVSDPSFYPHIAGIVRFTVVTARQQWAATGARQQWQAAAARQAWSVITGRNNSS